MKKCTKCLFENNDDNMFCIKCGERLPAESFVPENQKSSAVFGKNVADNTSLESGSGNITCYSCGASNDPVNTFCDKCGANLKGGPMAQSFFYKEDKSFKGRMARLFEKIGNLSLGLKALLVLIPLVTIGILSYIFIFSKVNYKNYVAFVKDNSLIVDKYDAPNRRVLSTNFGKNERNIGNFVITPDGTKLIFVETEKDKNVLNWRNMKDSAAQSVQLDSTIYFDITNDGKMLYYLTAEKDLYEYDFKEKKKIGQKVESAFELNNKNGTVVYLTEDKELYVKPHGKEGIKIDSDVRTAYYAMEKEKLVYLKGKDIYVSDMKVLGKVVVSDVAGITAVYPDGTFHYIKEPKEKKTYLNFVNDEKRDSDAKLTKPENLKANASPEEVTKHQNAVNAFEMKIARDELRKALSDTKTGLNTFDLFYYDTAEKAVAVDAMIKNQGNEKEPYLGHPLKNKVIGVYTIKENYSDRKNLENLKPDDLPQLKVDITKNGIHFNIVSGEKIERTDFGGASFVVTSKDNKKAVIYDMIGNDPNNTVMRLLSADFKDYKLSNIVEIGNGIKGIPDVRFTEDNDVFVSYVKDKKTISQINGKEISSSMMSSKIYKNRVYFVDGDKEKKLKVYEKGTVKDIDDNVSAINISYDNVYYIKDADNRGIGDLYRDNSGKKVKIDSGVRHVFSPENSIIKPDDK